LREKYAPYKHMCGDNVPGASIWLENWGVAGPGLKMGSKKFNRRRRTGL